MKYNPYDSPEMMRFKWAMARMARMILLAIVLGAICSMLFF